MSTNLIKVPKPGPVKQSFDVSERADLQPAPMTKPEPIDYGPHAPGNDLKGRR